MVSLLSLSVWRASKFSKTSFLKWASTGIFTVKAGISVKLEGYEQGEFKPPKTCQECQQTWEDSGLEAALMAVP